MKDYNPYSGIFDVPENLLSPRLQESLKRPDWELHYSLIEPLVKKSSSYPFFYQISDRFYDGNTNSFINNEAGFVYKSTTYEDPILVATLPVNVKWNYAGLISDWGDYYLAYYPQVFDANQAEVGFLSHFLPEVIEVPYIFRPNAERIVPVKGKKSPYKFKLASEDIGEKTKNKKKHPLLRNED